MPGYRTNNMLNRINRISILLILILLFTSTGCKKSKHYTVDDLPMLLSMARAEDKVTRFQGLAGIGQLGPEAKETVPFLIETLNDRDWMIRSLATFALGEMGPEAMPAAPKLLELLSKADDELLSLAIAIRKIHPDPVATVPLLIKGLDTDQPNARYRLIQALASYGPDAASALGPLVEIANNDKDETIRKEARKAIEMINKG